MAVYTDVGDADLEEILKIYRLGALRSFKGIAEGVENSNFLLAAESGNYILTLYEKRVAEADLPFFLGLMEHLAERGIRCPLPIKGSDGLTCRRVAGRPATLVTFLDGMWVRKPQTHHCAQVGKALAELHLAGRGFALHRQNALGPEGWPPLFAMSRARADTVEAGLVTLVEAELEALAKRWPSGLPAGVIHADLFPDNVFFLKGKLSGLIDFYFACDDLFAYDLAICLNAWCFEADGTFNVTKGRAMIQNYEAVRRLLPEERDALPVLARGAALRFLLTRLYDWLEVPPGALVTPKDPREYLRKLRFHQKAESAAAYGLAPA
jgi:homoserine kinase type II